MRLIEARASVAALVLAAGRASRFGAGAGDSKVLAPLRGQPLLAHVLDAVAGSLAAPCLVVVGHAGDAVAALAAARGATVVRSPDYAAGMAHSLRAGLNALPPGVEAALILLADMPLVTSATLDALMAAFADAPPGTEAVVPVHEGQRGNPVLVARAVFPRLLALRGDAGARHVLAEPGRSIVLCPVADAGIRTDIDTRDALHDLGGNA